MADSDDITPEPVPTTTDTTVTDVPAEDVAEDENVEVGSAPGQDDSFDPAYVHERYPYPTSDAQILWRPVLSEGQPVGILFTDGVASTRVSWVLQPATIDRLDEYLRNMKAGGFTAPQAYDSAATLEEIEYGPETFGTLARAQDELAAMGTTERPNT